MSTTFLQAVNKVMRNTRNDQVGSVSSSEFALMVGQYINKAKDKVEDAWSWRQNIVELQFNTVASQQTYFLDAVGTTPVISTSVAGRFCTDRAYLARDTHYNAQVFDITSGVTPYRLKELTRENQVTQSRILGTTGGISVPVAFSYTREGGRETFTLADLPVAGRTISARFHIPQDDLNADSDIIVVPWRPIVTMTTAMLYAERGEELGPSPINWTQYAEDELARAIANEIESDYLVMEPV